MKMEYQVELVWNREFDFAPYGNLHATLDGAIEAARALEDMGDGACVKKTRVITDGGEIAWQYGGKCNGH